MADDRSSTPVVVLGLDPRNAYHRSMIEGVIEYGRRHGPWEFQVMPRDRAEQSRPIRLGPAVDGLIISAHRGIGRQLRRLADLPIVRVLSPTVAGRDPVVNDDEAATVQLAIDHLTQRGLRRIGFVDHFDPPSARRLAFVAAAEAAGLNAELFPPLNTPAPEDRNRRIVTMVDWLQTLPRPIGLFCFSVHQAQMLSAACRRCRLRMPDDLAILACGGDDIDCHLATPPLSTIDQGGDRIGWEAAALLDRLMRGQPIARRTVVVPPAGVTRRQSTDLLAVDDENVAAALRLIRDRAHTGLTVGDVAGRTDLSRRQIEYAFRRTIGRTIHQQIQREKLDRAKRLLVRTALPLADIAARCGYSYATRLSEAVKRDTNLTPSAYRRRHRSAIHR